MYKHYIKLKNANGLSLIEVLIAIVIGMVGMLIIFQVFALAEGSKRTTAGVTDAQTNGSLALYTIERDLRLAGLGFGDGGIAYNNPGFLGCVVNGHDKNRGGNFSFTLFPFQITPNAGGPDTLTVVYGGSNAATRPRAFTQAGGPTADYVLQDANGVGYLKGDFILVAAPGVNCSLSQLSKKPDDGSSNLEHKDTERYNPTGGIGAGYPSGGALFNLGNDAHVRIYSVVNDYLVVRDEIAYSDANGDGANDNISVAYNVADLKAQYGKDTNDDGVVDTWDRATPGTTAQWNQVLAIRVGLLVRSSQFERADVTTAMPAWAGGQFNVRNPADGTRWQRYRYRVYQTVITPRNLIWGR